MTVGSIALGTQVSAVGISDSGSASTLISTSLASNGLDGVSLISSSVTTQGFSEASSSSSSPNLPLILGLTIGLGVLRTSLFI